jgi:hypothetical protein
MFNKGQTEVARWTAEQERTLARHQALERRIRAEVQGALEARLEEAKLNEATAEERLKAAEARLAQYETARQAGPDSPSRSFSVRAPLLASFT